MREMRCSECFNFSVSICDVKRGLVNVVNLNVDEAKVLIASVY